MVERHLAKVEVAGPIPVSRLFNMNITDVVFKMLPHSRISLSLVIAKQEVQAEHARMVKYYQQRVTIKGFRKGKVPEQIVLSRFSTDIGHDAMQRLAGGAVQEALKGKDYQRLQYDPPQLVNTPEYQADQKLAIQVEFDVFPSVTLAPYQNIQIRIPEFKIGVGDVQRELARIQQSHTRYHDKDAPGVVEKNDSITIDCWELVGEQRQNVRRDIRVIMGDERAPPFASDLIGMRANEEKTVADGGDATKKMIVQVKSMQRAEIPAINDALAARVSSTLTSLKELKKSIRSELEQHAKGRTEYAKRAYFTRHVADASTIDVPLSMIQAEKDIMWGRLCTEHKATEEQLLEVLERDGKTKEDLFQEWNSGVVTRVKESIVIRELQQKENIVVDATMVDAFIAERAAQNGHDPKTLKKMYVEHKKMDDVVQDCREQALFERLFTQVAFAVDKKLKAD